MDRREEQGSERDSLMPVCDLWSAVERDLAVSRRQAVAIVHREIQRLPIDLFFGNAAPDCLPLPLKRDEAEHLLSEMGNSEFARVSSADAGDWETFRLRKSDAREVASNIEFISIRLPDGALMKGAPSRPSWQTSHMISVSVLCETIASFNEITLEDAARFVWNEVNENDVGSSLYALGEALPICVGYAAWIPELRESMLMREPQRDILNLAQFAFDPIDAETIFMQFPFAGNRKPTSTGFFLADRTAPETRESKEYYNRVLNIKAAQLRAASQAVLMKLARDKPKNFARWCCQLVLFEETDTNPLETFFPLDKDGWTSSHSKRYEYLARAVLRQMAKEDALEQADQEASQQAPYVDLFEATFEEMHSRHWEFLPPRVIDSPHMRRIDLIWSVFGHFKEALELALTVISEKIWHGVPLYVRDPAGGFRLVDVNDENWVYLRMCGKHGGMADCTEPPSWFDSYFLSRKDLAVHSWLFNYNETPTDAELAERRQALSKQLDLPKSSVRGTEKPATSMLGFVETVQRRWYGQNFDPNERDTYPKQTDVVAWLMSEHGLSRRQAEAIDIVTRPDQARRTS
jgi:hypothetical protein